MTNQLHPFHQFRYHLGCAYRHTRNAFFAYPWPFLLLLVVVTAVLAGCESPTPAPKPPPPVVITPAPTPTELEAKRLEAERLDAAAAAAKATALALEHAPDGTPAKLAKGENGVVQANLPPPTEPALAVAIGRVMTGLNGDIKEAQRQQEEAAKDAGKLAERLRDTERKLEQERNDAAKRLAERESSWNGKFNDQNNKINELTNEVQKAKDATSRKVQFWFGLILRLVAAGLLLVAGLKAKAAIASGLPSGEAVRGSVALLALSASGFALSWAVAQWWFFYACAGFAALVFGTWAAHAYFADKAKGTLNKIGEAIDAGKVLDSAGQAVSATVDLAALGRAMNSGEKAVVNKLRKVRAKAKATLA